MATSKANRLDIEIDGIPYKLFAPGAGDDQASGRHELPPEVYNVEEVEPLLSRLGQGDQLNYGDFPPTIESVIAQDDWSTGLAPIRHDLGGKISGTYWLSSGVDARQPHQLALQPKGVVVNPYSSTYGPWTKMIDFNGSTYAAAGHQLLKYSSGTGSFDTYGLNGTQAPNYYPDAAGAVSTSLFNSIGTGGPTGTLVYWTFDLGVPTISSNVVTMPAGSRMHAGHPNWTDNIFYIRFQWATGGTFYQHIRYKDASNWLRVDATGTALQVDKDVAGTVSSNIASVAASLTNGTWYWLKASSTGTSYTFAILNDNAGAVGAQIATATTTVADAVLQSGAIALETSGASMLCGGAFAGVCQVTTTANWPANFVPNTSGEHAFNWEVSGGAYNPWGTGHRAISIYAPAAASAYYGYISTANAAGDLTKGVPARFGDTFSIISNWRVFSATSNTFLLALEYDASANLLQSVLTVSASGAAGGTVGEGWSYTVQSPNCAFVTFVHRQQGAGATGFYAFSFGGVIQDLAVFGVAGGATYMLVTIAGGATPYWYTTDGVTFTQSTLAGTDSKFADYFLPVRGVLWKAVRPNKLYSCADPTNGAIAANTWTSTAITVGDASRAITGIAAYKVDLAIAKEDGLWTVDRAGNDFPILPELRAVSDINNGKNIKSWRNGLNFRVRNGFWRYLGAKLESIGLDRYRSVGASGTGAALRPVDQAPYLNELFVVHTPATTNGGIYLASLQEDRTTTWKWHLPYYFPGYTPTMLGISANMNAAPTLVIGRQLIVADGSFQYDALQIRLPNASDNPLDDPSYVYDNVTAANLVTMLFSPLPEQDKHWQKVVIHQEQGGAGAVGQIQLAYTTDPIYDAATLAPTWTAMVGPQNQTIQGGSAAGLGIQEWFFPGPVTSKAIQFRITLTTAASTSTPVVKHLVLHYKHRPYPRKRWKVQVIAEDKAAGPRHYLDRRVAEQVLRQLQRTRINAQPVKLLDVLGDTYTVTLEKVSHRLLEKYPQGGRRYVVSVEMLEFPGTVNPALRPLPTL